MPDPCPLLAPATHNNTHPHHLPGQAKLIRGHKHVKPAPRTSTDALKRTISAQTHPIPRPRNQHPIRHPLHAVGSARSFFFHSTPDISSCRGSAVLIGQQPAFSSDQGKWGTGRQGGADWAPTRSPGCVGLVNLLGRELTGNRTTHSRRRRRCSGMLPSPGRVAR